MSANRFESMLATHGQQSLYRSTPTVLQVNVGKRCNQACRHCHVNAGPTRTEVMTPETVDRILELLSCSPSIEVVDITGGAPELNPSFQHLVSGARSTGRNVIDRCNLTVLSEPGQENTAEFLATQRVEVIASLPCYGPDNVDAQRGSGVFERSIEALRLLNRLGYADPESGLKIHLVYNPMGAFLPPDQEGLQRAYKARLQEDFGVSFNHLYTLTNMPIERFASDLRRQDMLESYIDLLCSNFNPAAVPGLMCLNTVSVGWEGDLYDCDFNQMLEIPAGGTRRTVWEMDSLDALAGDAVATGVHCLGCTAGAGSSCRGALA